MSRTITAEGLKKKIDGGEKFILVDTLKPPSYEARHVPTAINVPASDPDFLTKFEATNTPKDAEIMTYCSSATCTAHMKAADALEAAGYTNVVRFSDGLAGWQNAGFGFSTKV